MNLLYCGVDVNEYNRVSIRESVKEIQEKLEVIHRERNQIKESKINMLVYSYKLFELHDKKSITDMFTRFTDINNAFKSLEKSLH